MNPFELSEPWIAFFDLATIVLVARGLYLILRNAEDRVGRPTSLNDPYQIAWLRGGTDAAARLAMMSLIARGRLDMIGKRVVCRAPTSLSGNEPLMERAVLAVCATPIKPNEVVGEPEVHQSGAQYRGELENLRLVPDAALRATRGFWLLIALAAMAVEAGIRVWLVPPQSMGSAILPVFLWFGGVIALDAVASRHRTQPGTRMLGDLSEQCRALLDDKDREAPQKPASEMLLLGAIFGLEALPRRFDRIARLLRPPSHDS